MRPCLLLLALLSVPASSQTVRAQDSRPAKPVPPKKVGEPAYPSAKVVNAGVEIKRTPFQAGDTFEVASSHDMSLGATVIGGGALSRTDETHTNSQRVSVVVTGAEEDGTVTSLELKVLELSQDGKRVAAIEGKTYTGELNAKGRIEFVDGAGKPVKNARARSVCGEVARGLEGGPTRQLVAPLPNGKLKVGAVVKFEARALRRILRLGNTLKVQRVVYRGTRTVRGYQLAVFDLRATTQAGGQTLVIGGEVLIDPKTGRLSDLDLAGALTISRRKKRGTEGEGTLRIRREIVGR
ncbi:MAG: hypothetical protein JKY65_18555 [Planctomycetes bacterium]|nr:hypothetical protein [Planctomycetota bacterium]